jgi:hypothetical protein
MNRSQQSRIRRGRIFQQIQNPQSVPLGELQMIGFLEDGLGGIQGVAQDELSQIGVLERYSTHQQRLFRGVNPQGHPAIIFDDRSRHGLLPDVRIQRVHQEAQVFK